MTKQESQIIHFFLGLIFFTVLLIQAIIIPGSAAGYAGSYSELAYLAPLYVTALVVAFAGLQVALLAAWYLVKISVTDRIWAGRQAKWTNLLTGSLLVMAVVLAYVFIHAGSVVGVGGPPMLFGIVACVITMVVTIVLHRWIKSWFQYDSRVPNNDTSGQLNGTN